MTISQITNRIKELELERFNAITEPLQIGKWYVDKLNTKYFIVVEITNLGVLGAVMLKKGYDTLNIQTMSDIEWFNDFYINDNIKYRIADENEIVMCIRNKTERLENEFKAI